MSDFVVTLLALIVVIAADLWLIRWIRQHLRGYTGSGLPGRQETHLAGADSPLLAWLRHLATAPRLALSALHLTIPTWLKLGLEISILAVVAVAYTFPILDFNPLRFLPGTEYETHVGSMTFFIHWLAGQADFPLWNPIVGHGRSLIGDPFLFVFNPFLSLPIALLGVVNGSKFAAGLNFFIAGLGVWCLCRLLAFSGIARLWSSLLYMLSGALPAHLFDGQLQLTFALGWLPWSIAGYLWVLKEGSWRALLGGSLAQALFFFTGNLYYQFYGFICLLLIGIVHAARRRDTPSMWLTARRTLALGVISFGLMAVQFLPLVAALPSLDNRGGYLPEDTEFFGSQLPQHALLNYLVPDLAFSQDPSFDKAPFVQESYRYIGIVPLLALAMLGPAFRSGRRRIIIAFAVCFVVMLAWTSVRYSFIRELYRAIPALLEFRWPGRALSVGALFLILLGGFGLDELSHRLRALRHRVTLDNGQGATLLAAPLRFILLGLFAAGLASSLNSPFTANRELLYLVEDLVPEVNASVAWLREHDPAEYAVATSSEIGRLIGLEAYAHRRRVVNITDGWGAAPAPELLGPPEAVTLQPKYVVLWEDEKATEPGARALWHIDTLTIWQVPDVFPYAFLVPAGRLSQEPPALDPQEVVPLQRVRRDGPNRIVVEARADVASVLVISESWFTDWKVSVDGQSARVESVSNLLAVRLPAGDHRVVFEYDPPSFKLGMLISGLTLVATIGLAAREQHLRRRSNPK